MLHQSLNQKLVLHLKILIGAGELISKVMHVLLSLKDEPSAFIASFML